MGKQTMSWKQFQKEVRLGNLDFAKQKVRHLKEFGPSWEVVQLACELSGETELCMNLLDGALSYGVLFSTEELLILIRNLNLSQTELVRRMAFLLEDAPERDELLAMRPFLDPDTFRAINRYYHIGIPEEELQKEHTLEQSMEENRQISEAILRLSMVNVREGVYFLSDSLSNGARFTPADIIGFVKMLDLKEEALIKRLIESSVDPFRYEDLLEIKDNLSPLVFTRIRDYFQLKEEELYPVGWEEYYEVYTELRAEEQRKYFLALTEAGPANELVRVAIVLEREQRGLGRDFLRNMLRFEDARLEPDHLLTLTINMDFKESHDLLYHLACHVTKPLSFDQLHLMEDLLTEGEYEA